MASAVNWVVNALVDATPISGPARVSSTRFRLADHRALGDVANGERRQILRFFGVTQRRQGVGRFAGLGYGHEQGVRCDHGFAIAVFAGDLDARRDAADLLDEVARHQAGVEAGAAGRDMYGLDLFEYLLRGGAEGRIQKLAAGDPLLQGLRDGAWLFMDFLEHEVPVLAAFHGIGRQLAFAYGARRARPLRRGS